MSIRRMMLFTLGGFFKSIISLFKTRVLSDGGNFEAETNLENQLNALGSTLFNSASLVITPNGVKTSKLYTIKPNDGTGDLSVTRATTATRVNESGVIVDVPANVARIDYSNGSPAILVEPQRTNLLTYSEDFSNATWFKLRTTINSNTIVAPDGNLSADGIYPNNNANFNTGSLGLYTSGNTSYLQKSAGVLSVGTYTFSFFIKKNNLRYIQPRISTDFTLTSSALTANILDLQNKTIYFNDGRSTVKIKDYSNDFVRYEITFNVSTSATYYLGFWYWKETSGVTDGTLGYNLWGVQLEAGSNATSYIPTVASAVTRNDDVISKNGISNLIGQTEGTIFIDVYITKFIQNYTRIFFDISSIDTSNRLYIDMPSSTNGNLIQSAIRANSVFQVISERKVISLGRIKAALAYKSGDCAFYVNGSKINFTTNNTFIFSANFDLITIGSRTTSMLSDSISDFIVYKTRLSDTQLQQLTTL